MSRHLDDQYEAPTLSHYPHVAAMSLISRYWGRSTTSTTDPSYRKMRGVWR